MSKFCESCGMQLEDAAKFCNKCGKTIAATTPSSVPFVQNTNTVPQYNNVQPQTAQYTNQNYAVAPNYYQPQNYQNLNNTAPMTLGQYIVTFIVLSLPLIGIIMMFVWGFGSDVNINKKNLCRAILIFSLIVTVLFIIFGGIIFASIASIINSSGGFYAFR